MRIGIDVRKIADYGIGTHIRNVVLPAASLAQGHEFIFYYDPSNTIDVRPSFRWIEEPSGKYSVWEHFSLARKAKANGVQLFHSPHYTLPLMVDCPSIVTIHDVIHLKFPEYFPGWKVQAAKYVMKQAAQKARRIIAVSETTRKDLLQWFPGIAEKIRIIYNRLPQEWFQPPPAIDLNHLGIPADFLLYVGNFKKHKGIETLIQAYSRRANLPPLVLVGQGHQMDHELSARILSTPNVRLLGFADAKFLRKLYAQALLFVFPSLYEGFGYPPLEAMASGCCVLSSDAPAMKEVLGSAAEFFERGNAEELLSKIQLLLSDGERRNALRNSGLQQAKKFATDESPRRLLEEWNRI
ncbi:glycosyltransferase family 4 protein [bacterium]|nr:glycosyltransferase family 4 protein [bacterium]MCI0605424.1 glycosyltransferase family 4 protein [bacterium]